ncbi:hypothetical protein [Mucisphaera calidilacus]|uniref:Periplasmic protein n=1 Tax=Mucisphaera calidilacus TaxID=2527982 RepID=A0A518BWN7_9BACT|nr:hypothetical protein [Mucisphaera calidilacus]QDU71386.1 periplasmic protein [Mucisphaera calidilacus]
MKIVTRKNLLWTGIAVASIGLLGIAALPADAQFRGDRQGPDRRGMMSPEKPEARGDQRTQMLRTLFRDVNLTDEQRETALEIGKQHRAEMQAWREANEPQLRELMADARDARELDDRDQLQALMAEFRELRESAPQMTDSLEGIRDILDEDQLATFDENLEKIRSQIERRMPQPGERRGPGFDQGRQGRGGPGFDQRRQGPGRPGFDQGRQGRGGPGFDQRRQGPGRPGFDGQRQGPPGPGGPEARGDQRTQMLRTLFRDVNLTDEQREAALEIGKQHRAEMQAWREANEPQLRELMADARDARELDDRDQLQALMAEFRELRESAPQMTDSLEGIRDILDEDQLATFDENLEKIRSQIERRMPQPGERRGPGRDAQRPRGPRSQAAPEQSGTTSAEKSSTEDQLDL